MTLEAVWAPENLERASSSQQLRRTLNRIYQQIPQTTCRQRAHCCRDCPPMYYVEYVNVLQTLQKRTPQLYLSVTRRALDYFFFYLVDPSISCPFLSQRQCVIYAQRPRICRVYGLYEQGEDLAAGTRRLGEQIAIKQRVLAEVYAVHGIRITPRPPLPFCPHVRGRNGNDVSLSRKVRRESKQQVRQLECKQIGVPATDSGQTFVPFATHFAYSLFGATGAQSLQISVLRTYQADREAARAQVRSLLQDR
jgi:Fe-S-cluster containining protein